MAIDRAAVSEIARIHPDAASRLFNLLVDEATLRWEDLRFPANGINPPGAISDPSRDSTETDFPGTLIFSGSADNMIAGVAQMPHAWLEGSAIYPHIHWTKPAGGAGDDVTWQLYYRLLNRGAVPGAWSSPVSGTLAVNHNGAAEGEAITSFGSIDMTSMPVSTNVAWRLYRRGSSDSFNGTARLIDLDFHIQIDSRGSIAEYSK